MRQAKVYYHKDLAGILTETDDGEYVFKYDRDYIINHPKDFISFSLPVTDVEYKSIRMFPFFDGLLPEGWLLNIAVETWKVSSDDKMGLLLTCCKDCVGAVSIYPMEVEM